MRTLRCRRAATGRDDPVGAQGGPRLAAGEAFVLGPCLPPSLAAGVVPGPRFRVFFRGGGEKKSRSAGHLARLARSRRQAGKGPVLSASRKPLGAPRAGTSTKPPVGPRRRRCRGPMAAPIACAGCCSLGQVLCLSRERREVCGGWHGGGGPRYGPHLGEPRKGTPPSSLVLLPFHRLKGGRDGRCRAPASPDSAFWSLTDISGEGTRLHRPRRRFCTVHHDQARCTVLPQAGAGQTYSDRPLSAHRGPRALRGHGRQR